MQRSLKDTLKFSNVLEPQTYSADATTDSVDNAEGMSTTFLVNAGDFDFSETNNVDLVVQHSDDNTTFTAVADADIHDAEDGANGIAKTLDSTDDKNTVHAVHYRGNKRYVHLSLEETGTVSVPMSVVAVQGHLKSNPPA